MPRAAPESVRRWLSSELPWLVDQGLLNPQQVDSLRHTYALDSLTEDSSRRLSSTIFFIGALLIGCGIFALVAYHWEALGTGLKLGIIVAAILAAHSGGFLLWNRFDSPRLGHALITLGTLIFFAGIGLVAQIFHISSDGVQSFLALYVGAVAVALSLPSVPNYTIAALGIIAWSFSSARAGEPYAAWLLPILGLHTILGVVFVRLTRSRFALTLAWAAGALLLARSLDALVPGIRDDTVFFTGLVLPGILAALLATLLEKPRCDHGIVNQLDRLASWFLAGAAFTASFQDVSRRLAEAIATHTPLLTAYLTFAVLAVGITAIRLRTLSASPQAAHLVEPDQRLPEDLTITTYPPVVLAAVGGLLLISRFSEIGGTIAANFAVLLLSAHLLGTGLRHTRRGRFWFGLVLVLVTILARFFEYDTNLLWKSVAFIASGVVVLLAGLWFERRVKAMTRASRAS